MGIAKELGWLAAFVLSWGVPLALDEWGRLRYFESLLIWVIPIAHVAPLFAHLTDPGARRRKALIRTVLFVVSAGLLLDFVLGGRVLSFKCAEAGVYVLPCLPALGGRVPVEELLFYVLAPIAIVLVYAALDEHWLHDPKLDRRRHELSPKLHLIHVRPRWLVAMLVLLAVAGGIWWYRGAPPIYFIFLIILALTPIVFLFDALRDLTNWPAFAMTTFYAIATSLMYEVTLAIPRGWWRYQHENMLFTIDAWSRGAPFPLEAAIVWVCAPFSCILAYELGRALLYHPAPSARKALFGR